MYPASILALSIVPDLILSASNETIFALLIQAPCATNLSVAMLVANSLENIASSALIIVEVITSAVKPLVIIVVKSAVIPVNLLTSMVSIIADLIVAS